jgi:MinD-like ATPase involved in chromosome partitioning or flagellar assembly
VIEPEVAIAFTADPWVEVLHRHLTDHGGARVRSLVVEPEGALDESYDVLLAGHRWSVLTRALVAEVRARGRAVIGVFDADEPAGRRHLHSLGVDAFVESDAGPEAFVRAIAAVAGRRSERTQTQAPTPERRHGRLIVVGGPAGTGRTEISIELAVALGRRTSAVLLDADDVGPAVAPRLQLPLEPNLRTAIDAVEHARGDLDRCVVGNRVSGLHAVCGLPNASAWSHIRPGEVVRVAERLARESVVVADVGGPIEDVQVVSGRGRYATTRALLAEADVVVCVCDASPTGVGRLLSWIVDARTIAPSTPFFAVVNRAPSARFRRGELFEELTTTVPVHDVAFVPADARVSEAAWNGTTVGRGAFTRVVSSFADKVLAECRPGRPTDELEIAS